jgi:hypothetical protein
MGRRQGCETAKKSGGRHGRATMRAPPFLMIELTLRSFWSAEHCMQMMQYAVTQDDWLGLTDTVIRVHAAQTFVSPV